MVNLAAKADRRKKLGKKVFTIPYEPEKSEIAQSRIFANVDGSELRRIRTEAGHKTQFDFALACGWSQAAQCKYERPGLNSIKIEHIFKMIRVCNGGY